MSESFASWYCQFSSPVGPLVLTSDGDALTGLRLPLHDGGPAPLEGPGWRRDEAPFRDVVDQLHAYFDGERTAFDLPLRMTGTPFQRLAWEALRTIPFGTTISYAEQAQRIGRAGASRAVGAANGRNPIAIIVPCHRVIGSSGTLTGYGGGLPLKQWLLDHESSMATGPIAGPSPCRPSSPREPAPSVEPPGGVFPDTRSRR